MSLRIFQLSTALFWLGTVAWLVATVVAPPGSRMRGVEVEEAYMTFFRWNDTTNMVLLENGRYRGQLSVAGSSGEDRQAGRLLNSVSVWGQLGDVPGDALGGRISWRALLEFTEEMELHRGDFSLRVPESDLTARLNLGGLEGDALEAEVTLGGVPIFQHQGTAAEGTPGLPAGVSSLMPALALDFSGDLDPAAWEFDFQARRGMFPQGGQDLPGYLLTLVQPDTGIGVRIILSEAGEPFRVETDFGFEAVSEMLTPLDAYRKEDPSPSP